jgi:hypothetical protein
MMPIVIQLQTPVRYFPPDAPHGILERPSLPSLLSRAEDRWLRGVVSGDPHVNVLVECLEMSVASGMREMVGLCALPPHICVLPGELELPDCAGGHVLIGDISTLTLRQQIDFYDWLDRFGDSAQVVSLTSVPLWPLVAQGRFFEGLFYRLNVVSLQACLR